MSNNKKISQFTQQLTYLSTDLINIVRSSTNYTVPVSALPAFLGVTGTINIVGGSGTPVLEQPDATTNNIRTIEDGNGIIAATSALNGITISHNFTQDAVGVLLVNDLATASPTFPSFVPGAGIQIARAADVITITATGSLPATKTITVNSITDFPTAASGVITLEADTTYVISNSISTSNRFQMSDNSSVVGWSILGSLLEYTGSGTMFTGVDVDSAFINLRITATNGKVWDTTRTTGFYSTLIESVAIVACDTIGDFHGMLAVNIDNIICLSAASDGILIDGTCQSLELAKISVLSASASFIAINLNTSVSDVIQISNLIANAPAGAIGISGAAGDANLTAGGFGEVINSAFIGDITPLSGIVVDDDVQWNFSANQGIQDTMVDSLLSMQGNATNTVIATQSVGVLVAGTWVVEEDAQVTSTTAGRVTYNGKTPIRLPITASVSIAAISGGAKDMGCTIAINGTMIANSLIVSATTAGNPTPLTVPWQETLSEGDYIEVFVTNETDAVDVLVSSAVLRIN